MEELLRTRVGRFPLEDSLKLAEIEILMGLGQLQEHLIAVDSLFSEYPAVTVKEEFQKLLDNGNSFYTRQTAKKKELPESGYVRVYDSHGNFYAVYDYAKKRIGLNPLRFLCKRVEHRQEAGMEYMQGPGGFYVEERHSRYSG